MPYEAEHVTKKQMADEIHALRKRISEFGSSEAEIKRSLESYKECEKRFHLMADSLPALISYVDSEYRYRFNNKTYEKWHGISSEKIYGKHVKDILGEDAYQEILRYIDKALSGEEVSYEKLIHFKNGPRYILINYVPDLSEQGKVNGFFVLAHDITQRVKSEESLKLYAKRLVEIEEAQKQRLTRELHDQVGQRLSAIGMNLNVIRAKIPADDAMLQPVLDDSFTMLEQTTECIRDVMSDLRPAILDDYGLAAALRWYSDLFVSRTGVAVEFCCDDSIFRQLFNIENTLFRITQEALTNVAKHAKASAVKITLESSSGSVRLIIKDNGIGFDSEFMPEPGQRCGLGLLIMAERAQGVGGTLRVVSVPGQGTNVIVEVGR